MSSFLFIMAIEGIFPLFNKSKSNGSLLGVKIASRLSISLIIFVDDVIILGIGSEAQWSLIKEFLNLFFSVTGLSNDKQKYYIHHNCNNELLIRHIADLSTVKAASIDDRIKYMGYLLKPNIYLKFDWNWLLNKLQRKIEGWNSRWISLGSRLTLSTVVLQSVSVYWFLVMLILVRVFTNICRTLFNYLWHGKAPMIKFHLTS